MVFLLHKPAQPPTLRELNRQYDLRHRKAWQTRFFKLQINQQFKEAATNFAINFARNSSIDGMNRIFQQKSNKYERCFWLFTLICALLGSIYVSLIISHRFNAGSLQTVVESTNKPIFHIPFPKVSICNGNHLNWDRLEEAKHYFMPYENDTEKLRMFEMVIGLYDGIAFGEFKDFEALQGQPIDLVQNINFSLVYDFMTWRCEELLTNCEWRYYKMNCCDIFFKGKTEGGICWHFNTLTSEKGRHMHMLDNKYPWRVADAGPTSALNFHVMINEKKHFRRNNEKIIRISVMEPNVWHRKMRWVPNNSKVIVEIDPVIYSYDNDTRSLSPQQRQCVFNGESKKYEFKTLNGLDYTFDNCQSQCYQEHLMRYCNCTVDVLFPSAGYKACQIKDFLCLARYNDEFRFAHQPGIENYLRNNYQGMECSCLPNCYSLNYITDVRPTFIPANMRKNRTSVELMLHFRSQTMVVYRTSLVFGWVDLMVAFGGIAGLFLGCSLISAMEVLYFVLVEVPVFVFKQLKNKDKLKTRNQNVKHVKKKRFSRASNWVLNNRIMVVEKFEDNGFPIQKSLFERSKDKERAMRLRSQEYFLSQKTSFEKKVPFK